MAVKSWFTKIVGSGMKLDNLQDLLHQQLMDLYDAEEQIIQALPKMASAAKTNELKEALQRHLEETRAQKTRLERVFRELGYEPQREGCEAIEGLIAEGDELLAADGDPMVKDAALIAAAQRVEHYEMAGYGCARTFARQLGHTEVARLLQQTLEEEANTDERLTQIAEGLVNPSAARA